MTRRCAGIVLVFGLLTCVVLVPCPALVTHGQGGHWPADWPKELEPLRDRAQTIGVATGLQMDIYQIPFADPEEFEAVWPAILSLKSEGGTLTLYASGAELNTWPGVSNEQPCVRIHAPSRGFVRVPDPNVLGGDELPDDVTYDEMQELVEAGRALSAAPPWPESAYLPNGQLAEYVSAKWQDGRLTWVPVDQAGERAGFLQRARVDIELVVDGNVVDLNRTYLPPNTSIIDKRGVAAEEE